MKQGTAQHPKFRKLARRLGKRTYEVAGVLEMLWAMASQYTDDGDLSRFDAEDIAVYLDWEGDSDELLKSLIECGWLDRVGDSLVIHDWFDHCPEFVKKRDYQKFYMEGRRKKLDVVSTNMPYVNTKLGNVNPPTYTNQYLPILTNTEENTDLCAKTRTAPPEVQQVVDYWNAFESLPRAKGISAKREKAIKAILKDIIKEMKEVN
jgi:hypothetical protein